MELQRVVRSLNKHLELHKYKESSINGLQVKASKTVRRIGGAVDATQETIRKAAQQHCDLLVVHHGVKWKGEKSEVYDMRIRLAKKLGVSIYAAHLPLDIHPVVGNAAVLLRKLGINATKPFGKNHGIFWGRQGRLPGPISITLMHKKLVRICESKARTIFFGKKKIRTIACVTGGGSFALEEAKKNHSDLYITGELAYWVRHDAQELGMNVIALGHYHTETLGVKALITHLEKTMKISTVFIHGVAPQ